VGVGVRGFLNAPADPGTGLTHVGARDYDPSTGRFISVDPILDSADPQSTNGYAYADNNPVTKTDPTGLKVAGCTPGDDCGPINGGISSGTVRAKDQRPPRQGTGRNYSTWHNNVAEDALDTIKGQAKQLGWTVVRGQLGLYIPGASKKRPCLDLDAEGCTTGIADIVLTVLAPDGQEVQFVWEVKNWRYSDAVARKEAMNYVSWMNQDALAHERAPNAAVGWNIRGPHVGKESGPQTRYWGGNDGAVMYGNYDDDKVKDKLEWQEGIGEIGGELDLSSEYYKGYDPRAPSVGNQPQPSQPKGPSAPCLVCLLPRILIEVPVPA